MAKYIYDGPVSLFGRYICNHRVETVACTKERALSNVAYRTKQAMNLSPNSKIELDIKYLKEV